MKPLTNRAALQGHGTTGTEIRDKRVASLLLGLVLAACGGESNQGGDTAGATATMDGAGGSQVGGNSTGNGTNTASNASSGATTSPNFGSPGPVTSGASSGNGAGGNSTASSDGSTSGGSGGSGVGGGPGGAGGSAGASCEPQDVSGMGACDAAFGVFFLGNQCGWVSGCSCVGEDCDNGYEDEAACEAAHRECFDAGCAAQDATHVGACEPASRFVYNGFECIAMDGCSCVGDDCDATYSSMDDCTAAHAGCEDRELSCSEIEAAYDAYVSHTACQDDSDCTTVLGQCGVGLGGCFHAINRRWEESGLQALGEAWQTKDCGGGVCDCDEPPLTVVCDGGACAFQR
ncbi:MAG TPA: hypothetical protein VI197_28555 [Polyangiaceae bacterium]